jgi:phage gp29-like protein
MPKPLTLTQKVREFFTAMIPVQTRTVWDPRAAPQGLASQMDADRIHSIFSESEGCDVRNLFALYRDVLIADSHLQTQFATRKIAILGDKLAAQPEDKANADDVKAAAAIAELIKVPGWLAACAHLLDSVLWPCAVVEKVYAATGMGYKLTQLVPVDAQLLDYTTGRLMIRDTDPASGYPNGRLLAPDPQRYIIHRGHLLSTPDYWGGPFRSLVFWWFFSAMDRDAWARFLNRYGSPFMVGKYSQGDDASRTILERAFSAAQQLFGVVVSTETEIEIMQASSAPTGEAFEKFIAVANREKSKLILGQTLSADAQSTGLGSGTSNTQEEVRQDIRQFDGMCLAATFKDQLIAQFLRINGLAGSAKLVWGSDTSQSAESLSKVLESLAKSGLEVADESLAVISERLGVVVVRAALPPPPEPGGKFSAFSAGLLPLAGAARLTAPDRASGATERIASAGAAEVARSFREAYAPVRRLVQNSTSADQLLHDLRALTVGWSAEARSAVLTEALIAFVANGSLVTDR